MCNGASSADVLWSANASCDQSTQKKHCICIPYFHDQASWLLFTSLSDLLWITFKGSHYTAKAKLLFSKLVGYYSCVKLLPKPVYLSKLH